MLATQRLQGCCALEHHELAQQLAATSVSWLVVLLSGLCCRGAGKCKEEEGESNAVGTGPRGKWTDNRHPMCWVKPRHPGLQSSILRHVAEI
jgi:hypothetical protein